MLWRMQVDHPLFPPVCVERDRINSPVPLGLEDGGAEVVVD